MSYVKPSHLKKLSATLLLLGLRGLGLLSKFLLTIFIAKLMSLAELGLYGLIAVGATIVPAIFGLGVNGPANRRMVNLPASEAVRLASTRIGITMTLHLLITPIAVWVVTILVPGFDFKLVLLIAATLLLENIASDVNSILMARFKSTLAATLLFIRSGAWPLLFMGVAWFHPDNRTVITIIEFWLASLLFVFLILVAFFIGKQYWRFVGFESTVARDLMLSGRNFYIADIGNNGVLYLDRFLVTSFLGLEATGIYTFFWSVTNAVNNLIFFGVTSPLAPKIIAMVKLGNKYSIELGCRAMLKEIWLWCLGLSLTLFFVMPWVLRYLGNSKFEEHKTVFSIMLLATMLRTVSEGADNILYAHHQDRIIAIISLSAMVVSGFCIVILTPLFGLMGVAFAMFAVALFVFSWRNQTARRLIC